MRSGLRMVVVHARNRLRLRLAGRSGVNFSRISNSRSPLPILSVEFDDLPPTGD